MLSNTTEKRPKTGFFKSVQYYFETQVKEREKEAAERENKKFELENQCITPKEFSCYSFPLTDPVLLPCGHCINSMTVKSANTYTCPDDKQESKKEDWIYSGLLKDATTAFAKMRNKTISQIAKLFDKNQDDIQREIAAYKQSAEKSAAEFNAMKTLIFKAKKEYETIPDEFTDQTFTPELFDDPVLTKYGYVFERASLEKWILNNGKCPISREPLELDDLTFSEREDQLLQKKITKIIRGYKKNRDNFLPLIKSNTLSEATLSNYKKSVQEKVAEFEKTKKAITLDPLIKKLNGEYRRSGLPLTTKTQEQFDLELPVLSSDNDEWIPKSLALEHGIEFIECKEITENLWNLNNGLISLQKNIEENPSYTLLSKIQELTRLNEKIKFDMSQFHITHKVRRHLSTIYRNSGLPFPPIRSEEYKEQVLLESNRWESKQIALAERLPAIQSLDIENNSREWRTFHGAVYELEQTISHTTPLTFEDKNRIEQTIQELKTTQERLKRFVDEISESRGTMQTIIQNLQINLKDESHLRAWDARNNRCWHGWGGVEVAFQDPETKEERKYRIPTRAKKLMELASITTLDEGVDVLSESIYRAKSKRPSRVWNNPFSWMTRHAETEKLYVYTENLSLRNFEFNPRP